MLHAPEGSKSLHVSSDSDVAVSWTCFLAPVSVPCMLAGGADTLLSVHKQADTVSAVLLEEGGLAGTQDGTSEFRPAVCF